MLYVRAKDSHHDAHGTGNVEQNATELFDLPFGQFLEGIRDAEWLKAHAKDGGTRCRTSAKWLCPRSLTRCLCAQGSSRTSPSQKSCLTHLA